MIFSVVLQSGVLSVEHSLTRGVLTDIHSTTVFESLVPSQVAFPVYAAEGCAAVIDVTINLG